MYELVTPAKAGVQVGGCSPILDTGFRRYDGDFLLHRAGAISGSFMSEVVAVGLYDGFALLVGKILQQRGGGRFLLAVGE